MPNIILKWLILDWNLILDMSPNITKSYLIDFGLISGQIIRPNIVPKLVSVGPYHVVQLSSAQSGARAERANND